MKFSSKRTESSFIPLFVVAVLTLGTFGTVFLLNKTQTSFIRADQKFNCDTVSTNDINKKVDNQTLNNDISQVEQLNSNIFDANNKYNSLFSDKTQLRSVLEQFAAQRKQLFLTVLQHHNNTDIASFTLPKNIQDTLNTFTTNCVEQPVIAEGPLSEHHVHIGGQIDGPGSQSIDDLYVGTPGNLSRLHMATKDLPGFGVGKHIKYSGSKLDNEVVVNAVNDDVQPTSMKEKFMAFFFPHASANHGFANGQMNVTGTHKIALLFINFSGTSRTAADSDVYNMYNTTVKNFIQENSYGKLTYTVTSINGGTISSGLNCDATPTVPQALNNNQSQLDGKGYTHVIIVIPSVYSACGWADYWTGLASNYVSGWSSDFQTVLISDDYAAASKYIAAHGYIHSIGVYHSGFINCGSSSICSYSIPDGTDTDNGNYTEYGDLYSIMGQGTGQNITGAQKYHLGWVDSSSFTTVTSSGIYNVYPLASQGSGIKVLRISRGNMNQAGGTLFVEYRQPVGSDANFTDRYGTTYNSSNSDVYNGAMLHIDGTDSEGWRYHSILFDAYPSGGASAAYSTLGLNQSFTDPATSTKLTVKSLSSDHMQIEVDVNGNPPANTNTPTPVPPAATATPVATPTPTPAGQSQLLLNPGFESGNDGNWKQSTTASSGTLPIGNWTSNSAHSGSYYAWLDGNGVTQTDTIGQTVSIPSTVSSANLSFWLHITTAESTTTTAYDTMSVQVKDTSGNILATLHQFSNLNANSNYQQFSYDLSSYKGKSVQVFFTGSEDSSNQTSFMIDDTALTTQSSTTATPTPTKAPTPTPTRVPTPTPTASVQNPTPTKAPTAAPTSSSTGGNLIKNPGFELGSNGNWTDPTGDIVTSTSYIGPRSGSWWAWMGGETHGGTDSILQTVTIPSNITKATFSFYMRIGTNETTTTTAYDTLVIQVRNSSGTVLKQLNKYSNLNHNTSYVQRIYDVSAYKGQTVQFYFYASTDSSLPTTFAIDDVSLTTQ